MTADTYQTIVPFLTVADVKGASIFYEEAFRMQTANVNLQDGRWVHAEMHRDGVACLMLTPEGLHSPSAHPPRKSGNDSPVTISIQTEDAQATFDRAVAAGATNGKPPEEMSWGDRLAHLDDPDGYHWLIVQPKD